MIWMSNEDSEDGKRVLSTDLLSIYIYIHYLGQSHIESTILFPHEWVQYYRQ